MLPVALIASVMFAHAQPAQPPLPDPFPTVHYTACPGEFYTACTIGTDVYSPTDQGPYVLHHELGHVYLNQHPDRLAALAPLLGRPVYGPPGGVVDERAADLYAACQMRVRPEFEDDYRPRRGVWVYGCDVLAGTIPAARYPDLGWRW